MDAASSIDLTMRWSEPLTGEEISFVICSLKSTALLAFVSGRSSYSR